MDETITDRLCGLIARLRQQHAAIGATLGEIEACLAGPPPEEPAAAQKGVEPRQRESAERSSSVDFKPVPTRAFQPRP
jgi:hypothetical protein